MRTLGLRMLVVAGCCLSFSVVRADFIVPRKLATVDGDTVSNVSDFFGNSLGGSGTTRQYQMAASELAILGLNIGDKIIGVRSRLDNLEPVNLPVANLLVPDLEMTMAEAANALGSLSLTFASNMLNPVMVRDGPYTLLANSLPATLPGGTNTNPFGGYIPFDVPYAYQGGDLVFMFTRPALTGVLNLDGANSYPDDGTPPPLLYQTVVDRTVYHAAVGTNIQEFTPIYQFVVAPEPTAFALAVLAMMAAGSFRGRSRRAAM